jgi:murein DD-endopeptidase MepM/ murein hydrolase activator NlpD
MRKSATILLMWLVVLMATLGAAPVHEKTAGVDAACARCPDCCEFNLLNTAIRDGTTDRATAPARVKELISSIRQNYYTRGGIDYTKDAWVFPVEGYGGKAIGGRRGSGYKPKGYDFFDGTRHRAHAAHDIFIQDRDGDGLDDRTGNPVMVRSMTNGIVVAVETGWDASSTLRGGNYISIYNPSDHAFVYYAHNATVLVELGDIVRPGDIIATVGRTGLNAFKTRSPTHLHLAYSDVNSGNVAARNIYRELMNTAKAKGVSRHASRG